ncbi:sporulation peptidase YabG [Bacillus marinisedimentorum]|uniref:sporulation peptidase YabG n=1 Tax=Bacillus marinisedimentorum TaxID=1821260 RepID=UPI000872B7F8|nr:sporulation peptidase YabG [Bacillus marinisedimentorum]
MLIQVGDIVGRKSYGCDLLFRVIEVLEKDEEKIAILAGEEVRLEADAPIDDLVTISDDELKKRQKEAREREDTSLRLFRQDHHTLREKSEYFATAGYNSDSRNYFQLPGRVLHLDGDALYLKKCMELYRKLNVPVYSVYIDEKEMPEKIEGLMDKVRPDILVITGHDAYLPAKGSPDELKAYRHSRQFAQTVKAARRKVPHLDQLVIFAGACQSHFESLIRAGANFASSPSRVNIHALDPVYVVAKLSYTPFMDRINVWDVLRNTLTGEKGLGGIETRGLLRTGMPYKQPQESEAEAESEA